MKLRDTLNTENNYIALIDAYKTFILDDFDEIEQLKEDEMKGIQRHVYSNSKVINNIKSTISHDQRNILLATYSAGYPLSVFKEEYVKFVDSLVPIWFNNTGYVEMVWALSIGILLEIEQSIFDKLVDLVKKDDPEDYLIDYLVSYYHKDWPIRDRFMYNKPYPLTKGIIEADNPEDTFKLLNIYLKNKWYKGHNDMGWYNLHKKNLQNYFGYWSFESAAICKMKGVYEAKLKDLPYFPYDLLVGE